MTNTAPGNKHDAEPKRCVGVYDITSPFSTKSTLFDTGIRFYIADDGGLDAWAPGEDDVDLQYAENLLGDLLAVHRGSFDSPDTFIDWCIYTANATNTLGMGRCFATPQNVEAHDNLDQNPESVANAAAARALGL